MLPARTLSQESERSANEAQKTGSRNSPCGIAISLNVRLKTDTHTYGSNRNESESQPAVRSVAINCCTATCHATRGDGSGTYNATITRDIMGTTWEYLSEGYCARRSVKLTHASAMGFISGNAAAFLSRSQGGCPAGARRRHIPTAPSTDMKHNVTNAIATRTLYTATARLSPTRTSTNREHLFQILVSTSFSDPTQCMNQIFRDTRPAQTTVKYNCLLRTRGDDPRSAITNGRRYGSAPHTRR